MRGEIMGDEIGRDETMRDEYNERLGEPLCLG